MASNNRTSDCKKRKGIVDHVERHASGKQYKETTRQSYDVKFKLAVVNFAETSNNVQASEKFGVSECNVRRWKKDKGKLLKASNYRKAFRGPKKGRFPEIDIEVVKHCLAVRSRGLSVSTEDIQIKAAQTAREMGIPRSQFKASYGWVRRFMRRNNLCLRRKTTLAQRLPQEYEDKLLEFQRYVINLRKAYDYDASQIGNADETPVFFEMPSNTTVTPKGVKSVLLKTGGHEKKRCTVMLAVLGDGRKLPPFVIFKRKTMPKEAFPKGIVVRVHEKGWMDEHLMMDWLKCVWANRPGALLHPKAILSLDTFKGHLTESVKNQIATLNSDLVVIPGGMTSQLQVLDVCVNKPFKDYIRKEYKDWISRGDLPLTPAGKVRSPPLSLICSWILSAWACIKVDTIVYGFKKCCLTNAMDGSEDDILWEEQEAEENVKQARESESSDDCASDSSGSEED